MEGICSVLFFFSSVSVKVLPVTSLVSGIFLHRAFCAYFLRIERVVELRRFLCGHSRIINLACNGVESHVTRMAFYWILKQVSWINYAGGENQHLESQKRRVMDFDNNLSPVEQKSK